MKVDILIPNYNGASLLVKNLGSVLASLEPRNGEIIIVDDGSTTEDLQVLEHAVQKNQARIKLIKHKTNKGFSSAINTAASHSKADYIVLLNSDVSPSQNFLDSPILRMKQDPSLFGVGCMDRSHEADRIVERGRGIGKWKRGMLIHSRGDVDSTDTFWISGGSCIIRRKIFIELGGMDEILNPFYWEDIDLSYRAQKAGYRIMFDKESVVSHFHEEGSIKKNISKNTVTTTAYRNQLIFIWKNITNYHLLTNHLLWLPVHMVTALKRGDVNFFAGMFLAVIKLPAIIVRRQKQRRFYKISDLEIIQNIS